MATKKQGKSNLGDDLGASEDAKAKERAEAVQRFEEEYGKPPPAEIAEELGLPDGWKPRVEDGVLYLDRDDLLEYLLLKERGLGMKGIVHRLQLEIQLKQIEFQAQQAGRETQRKAAAQKALEVEETQLPDLMSRLTKKYGVDLRKVTICEGGKLELTEGSKVQRSLKKT